MAQGPSAADAGPVGLVDEVAEFLLLVLVFGEIAPGGVDDFAGDVEAGGGFGASCVVRGEIFDDVGGEREDVGERPDVFVPDVVGEVVSNFTGGMPELVGLHGENLVVDIVPRFG